MPQSRFKKIKMFRLPARPRFLHPRGAGFTIVEIIISFAMLTLSLAGFTGMTASSLKDYRFSKEKYVASEIAQEGMELADNKKVNHVICVAENPDCPISDWQTHLLGDFEVDAGKTDELLPENSFATYNASHHICVVSTPPNAGKFGYCTSGVVGTTYPENYTREVKIAALPAPDNSKGVVVTSTVTWVSSGLPHSLTLESLLFND